MKAVLALPALLLAAACSSAAPAPAEPSDGGSDASAAAVLSSLTISTGDLRPSFDPNWADYDVMSLNSVYPLTVTATASDPAVAITVHGSPAQSGVGTVFQLQPAEDFTVVASAPGAASTTYTVHYLPADLPSYVTKSYTGAGTEDVLLTPNNTYLLIVDRAGNALYYRSFAPQYVSNFQQTTLADGSIVYSANVGVLNTQGWTLGVDHLMDQHFGDLADYQLPAYAQHGVLPAEQHEMILLGAQHYVAESYVQRTLDLSVYNSAWSSQAVVMSNVFQEVENGNVLVEWDSANFPSLYSDSIYENTFAAGTVSDYLHLNSIDIDPSDGNFVVSFRHTSSIVKIDRHTAQILWTLGGKEDQYGLTAEQTFSMQHYVRMQPDGAMWIFDNEYPTSQETRILSFVLDQTNKKVTSFQVLYTKPSTEPQTTFMGSQTALSGGRLFCGWGGWYSSAFGPGATEIVNGAVTWSIEFPTVGVFSYRALPITAL